jgi:hypothetical protein
LWWYFSGLEKRGIVLVVKRVKNSDSVTEDQPHPIFWLYSQSNGRVISLHLEHCQVRSDTSRRAWQAKRWTGPLTWDEVRLMPDLQLCRKCGTGGAERPTHPGQTVIGNRLALLKAERSARALRMLITRQREQIAALKADKA